MLSTFVFNFAIYRHRVKIVNMGQGDFVRYKTFKELNELSIVDYLSSIGIEPARRVHGKAWYHSPLRDGDRTPSFIVWESENRWCDMADNSGKSLIDLGMKLNRCSAYDFLQMMNGPGRIPIRRTSEMKFDTALHVEILKVGPLENYELKKYLRERRIPPRLVQDYTLEVHFKIKKEQYAIGFKNDKGGYELRNSYAKVSSMPKDCTFIDNGSRILAVLEGQFDFYTHLVLLKLQQKPIPNFLILNGTGFFEQRIPQMLSHDLVRLFLDRGPGARNFTKQAISLDKRKFVDESTLYSRHDDYNDWWRLEGHRIFQKNPLAQDDERRNDRRPKQSQ